MVKHDSVLHLLGQNVRQARESKSLTKEKPTELAELDPTYISGIESGCLTGIKRISIVIL